MIDPTAFIKHLGPRVAHVTAASNLPSIRTHGLLCAHNLSIAANTPNIALRADRLRLITDTCDATLNHQRPILHGMTAARRMIDGHTPQTWAEQLDRRIFFWPGGLGQRFANSIELPIAVIWFDTERLIEGFGEALWLSPLNSGNFKQGGAHAARGDWLYVAVSDGLDAFRNHRKNRGLVRSKDTVREISLTRPIAAAALDRLIVEIET